MIIIITFQKQLYLFSTNRKELSILTILQTLLTIYLFIADARNRGGNLMRKRLLRSSAPPLSPASLGRDRRKQQRGQNTLKGYDLLVRRFIKHE